MQEYQPVKEGKVREIYDIGDALVMVATDRISAFDVILTKSPKKAPFSPRCPSSGSTTPKTCYRTI